MRKTAFALLLVVLLSTITTNSFADGLPVARYLEDPEHKNEVMLFYLSTIFTGINLVNNRIKPPLFCMSSENPSSAFELIDNRIKKLQKEKKLNDDMTVDSIMMDLLVDEFPCK
jgi:hypothetical protein